MWFLTDKPKTFSGRPQPLVVVVVGGDGGGMRPFQPLARAAFKLCGLNSQHFEFQTDMRRLGRELCLSLLHTCTHTHPLRGGGARGGNGGGWLPGEMKGRLSQKGETRSVDVAALCHGPQVAPLSLLAYFRSEAGRGASSGPGKQVGRELSGLTRFIRQGGRDGPVSRAPRRDVKRPLAAGRCLPGGHR